MEIKFNKNTIGSILLAGTIALNTVGCTRDIVKNKREKNSIPTQTVELINTPEVRNTYYVNKYNTKIDLSELNNTAYILTGEDNRYTLCNGANIYFKSEWNISDEIINDRPLIVKSISSNNKYTLVELPTGEKGYVENGYLVKCVNTNKTEYRNIDSDTRLSIDAYFYNTSGMYMGYLHAGEECHVIASNGEYAHIILPNGVSGYVLEMCLINSYQKIYGYAFVKEGNILYSDKGLTNMYRYTGNEIVYVEYITSQCAVLYDAFNNRELYVNPNALDDDFIDINLTSQKMDCYIDYQLAGSWNTRTGKDSTPTCEGAFDIDEKVSDWEFTTFPGSYAKHWIPISTETQQGIHDLVGDDEQNYGNEAYHTYGSHGCIRVPAEASQFVYDNYDVGDMVLVRKK